MASRFFALLRKSPMVRMVSVMRSSPSPTMACGVGASGKSRRVTRLTLLSVAWADISTAASSW